MPRRSITTSILASKYHMHSTTVREILTKASISPTGENKTPKRTYTEWPYRAAHAALREYRSVVPLNRLAKPRAAIKKAVPMSSADTDQYFGAQTIRDGRLKSMPSTAAIGTDLVFAGTGIHIPKQTLRSSAQALIVKKLIALHSEMDILLAALTTKVSNDR